MVEFILYSPTSTKDIATCIVWGIQCFSSCFHFSQRAWIVTDYITCSYCNVFMQQSADWRCQKLMANRIILKTSCQCFCVADHKLVKWNLSESYFCIFHTIFVCLPIVYNLHDVSHFPFTGPKAGGSSHGLFHESHHTHDNQ